MQSIKEQVNRDDRLITLSAMGAATEAMATAAIEMTANARSFKDHEEVIKKAAELSGAIRLFENWIEDMGSCAGEEQPEAVSEV